MKKYICLLGTVLIIGTMFMAGCSEDENVMESYSDYDDMESITVEGNKITLVLYEDQALPYRWDYTVTDDAIVLLEDKSIDKNDTSLQVGVSESYRVLIFECGDVNEERLYLRLESINGETKDVIEKHRYRVTYIDGQLICEEVVME